MIYVLALAAGYLLGSIPFGLILTRAMGLGDLRSIGSGNIGATNVLRTGNKKAAAATLLLDAAKGGLAVVILRAIAGDMAGLLAGLGAFLGHLYPVWLKFRGGKGVATFLGMLIAFSPIAGALTCATWLISAFATRISSAGALIAAGLAPLWLYLLGQGAAAIIICLMLTALIFLRHRENIERIINGTEPRIGQGK